MSFILDIEWEKPTLKKRKTLREHQEIALAKTLLGFGTADRGKLIMACGTGKTFTSLKIAESQAGAGRRVSAQVREELRSK